MVIVASFDEGELPHARSLDNAEDKDDALEAERRLAYVAMTRARRHLVMVHSADTPNRFIDEAAPEAERVDVSAPSPPRAAVPKEGADNPTGAPPAQRDDGPNPPVRTGRNASTGVAQHRARRGHTRRVPPKGTATPDLAGELAIAARPWNGQVTRVSLNGAGSTDAGAESPLVQAMVSVLGAMPKRSLSATLLTHILRNSEGRKTQQLMTKYSLAALATFGEIPFGELRRLIIDAASASGAFNVEEGAPESSADAK